MRDLCIERGPDISGPSRQVSDAVVLAQGLVVQGSRRRYKRNEEVFGEGEDADFVYRVVSGAVRTVRFSADGRRQILGFCLPGDVFGLECGETHALSAEALADTELALVRRCLIDCVCEKDPNAAQAMIRLMQGQLHDAQEHALVLGRKGAGERVASFLLRLADRVSAVQALDLPMSRLDIADYLALTIETVSRAFTQMEREHAIDLPSSRHVVMRDRGALELLEAA